MESYIRRRYLGCRNGSKYVEGLLDMARPVTSFVIFPDRDDALEQTTMGDGYHNTS